MRWYLHAVLSQVQAAEAARSAENSYAKDEGTPEDTQALATQLLLARQWLPDVQISQEQISYL